MPSKVCTHIHAYAQLWKDGHILASYPGPREGLVSTVSIIKIHLFYWWNSTGIPYSQFCPYTHDFDHHSFVYGLNGRSILWPLDGIGESAQLRFSLMDTKLAAVYVN